MLGISKPWANLGNELTAHGNGWNDLPPHMLGDIGQRAVVQPFEQPVDVQTSAGTPRSRSSRRRAVSCASSRGKK